MDLLTTYAYVPLIALVLGSGAGFIAGRWLGMRQVWMLIGLLAAVSIIVIIWLASVGEGEEATAFGPFVALTGGLFPALFGAIMGGVLGRALAKRNA